MAGHLNEKPLVNIRRALDAFGLEAAKDVTETEDHISALCEVMRYLIAGDDVEISNLTNQRVFFNDHIRPWYEDLCNAIDEECKLNRSITSDSPAASNKVFAISKAIKQAGLRCVILSLGRGRQNGRGGWHPATIRRREGVLVIYCGFLQLPLFTHIVSALSMTFLIMRLNVCNFNLIILAYNRSVHYMLALIYARICLIQSYLDLEDGYNIRGFGPFALHKNACIRWVYKCLCPSGAMVSCSGLSKQLEDSPKLVCYGVARNSNLANPNWESGPLKILFSGTLLEEVGSRLLIDAINILRNKHPNLVSQLNFVVTGKGPFAAEFSKLAKLAPDWLSFGNLLSREVYLNTLRQTHIGLSLRLPNFEMSNTTFPSKIIEYAEHGLLIVSTKVGDVPELLGESAIYLEHENIAALVDLLASLPARRSELNNIALQGHRKILQSCNSLVIGEAIRNMVCSKGSYG
jgi:glycosyltransferase involved in cell wall biosynthesis